MYLNAVWDNRGEDLVNKILGYVCHIRVVMIQRRPKKMNIQLFYNRVNQLTWDPDRFKKKGKTLFMSYGSNLRRYLLRKRHVISWVVERKRSGVFPINYKLCWLNVWDGKRARKEAVLLWSIWH
jgi:hypothetical protein